jgi:hypothetical protein
VKGEIAVGAPLAAVEDEDDGPPDEEIGKVHCSTDLVEERKVGSRITDPQSGSDPTPPDLVDAIIQNGRHLGRGGPLDLMQTVVEGGGTGRCRRGHGASFAIGLDSPTASTLQWTD